MNTSEIISSHLADRRKSAGLTQQQLGEQVEVSRQTIISIEKGNYTPSVLLALKIATVLETTVENIFYIHKK